MSEALSYEQLLEQYADVCSRALEEGRHQFPYQAIFKEALSRLDDPEVVFALYDDRLRAVCKLDLKGEVAAGAERAQDVEGSESPLREAMAALAAESDGSEVPPPAPRHVDGPRVVRIPLSAAAAVVEDPAKHIANPALIDWTWLIKDYKRRNV